jgi:glycosyltransferase involved in cell wall biosynthesis
VDCVLQAFALIQKEYPDARLILAGDGSERDRLLGLVQTLGLRQVEYVGRVPPDEMARLYDEADVYLTSPNLDNLPNSIMEAFASGLPVVTTRAGGIPYMVKHEETGLLVDCGDCEALAVAALRLLKEPGLALRLAANAREECLRRYVWRAVRSEWERIYLRLAGRDAARAL